MPCTVDHDFARRIGDVGQRQQQGESLHPRVCALERKPDAGQKHHRPAEQIQHAVGHLLAGDARGDDEAAANQVDTAQGKHQQQRLK